VMDNLSNGFEGGSPRALPLVIGDTGEKQVSQVSSPSTTVTEIIHFAGIDRGSELGSPRPARLLPQQQPPSPRASFECEVKGRREALPSSSSTASGLHGESGGDHPDREDGRPDPMSPPAPSS